MSKNAPRAQKGVPLGYIVGQIGPEKGPKGPFQVKFGSLLALWGLKRAQNWPTRAQKGPKGIKMASRWPQNRVNMGSKWPFPYLYAILSAVNFNFDRL